MYNTNTANCFPETLTNEILNSFFYPNRKQLDTTYPLIQNVNPVKKDGTIVIKYKLPGYEKSDIKIDFNQATTLVTDRVLTVKASNEEYGTVNYKSYIPKNIDEKLTKANLKNGILTLTFIEEKVKSPLANLKIEVD